MDGSLEHSLVGTIVDEKYQIVSLLGRGGMGDVYRAEHLRLQRAVALKLLRAQLADGSQGDEPLKRFEREAKIASRIDHPNAVSIFDFGIVQGQPYLVMSLVEGRTLKQVLLDEASLSTDERILVLEQVASALSTAHSLGIIHRDLKPDNIIIDRQADGSLRAQVLDFGLAKMFSDSLSGSSLTSTGDTLGTPLYMSPEQVQGIETRQTSDVYSLGIIAFEMLAGDVPFRAEQAMSVLFKHIHETPPKLQDINPSFPENPAVEAVFQKVLSKDPAARFESAPEFVGRLKSALTGVEYSVPNIIIPTSVPVRRSSAGLWSAVGILSLLLVGGFIALGIEHEAPKIEQAIKAEELELAEQVVRNSQAAAATRRRTSLPERTQVVDARIHEARLHLEANRPGQAQGILVAVIYELPNNAEAHFLLSQAHLQLGEHVKAVRSLREASRLDPDNKKYRILLDKVENGRLGKRLRQFSERRNLSPMEHRPLRPRERDGEPPRPHARADR